MVICYNINNNKIIIMGDRYTVLAIVCTFILIIIYKP